MIDFKIRTGISENDVAIYQLDGVDGSIWNSAIFVEWELDLDVRSTYIKNIGINVCRVDGFVEYFIDEENQTTETVDFEDWEIEVNADGVQFGSSITIYDVELWMASKKIVVNFD